MKKLLKNKSFFLFLFFLSFEVYGETFGFVNSIKNEKSFLLTHDEIASIVKNGDFLEPGSQLLVEEGGLVIFSDYFDNKYQLSSGGLVKFRSDGMELTRGSLKVTSLALNSNSITIETPNSIIKFSESEGTISYDPELKKTEVIVFDGLFELRSKNKLDSSVDVKSGQISSITTGLQLGMASIPTPTLKRNLEKIAMTFSENPRRTIASKKEGKIIFIKAKKPKPLKSHKREPTSIKVKHKEVPIRVYGAPTSKSSKEIDPLIKDLKSH
jgi:hypothetical protein